MIFLTIIGVIVAIVLLFAYSIFSWGYVLYSFWYWFIVPVFPQAPHITMSAAFGLSMVISLFGRKDATSIKKEYRDDQTWVSLLVPWMVLLIGYILHCCIS